MFENPVLTRVQKLPLATNKGAPIDNSVEADPPPPYALHAYAELLRICGKNWIERKLATGRYNCAGHVWASRRTAIWEVSQYLVIIKDDGYRDLRAGEPVFLGDIAVYFDKDNNDEILHVGRVFSAKPGIVPESPSIPRVLSKWNSTSGECLHDAYDVPYSRNFNFGLKFITDRP